VILIGDDYLYYLLYNLERDFKEIFKTKAQFDTEMANSDDNIREYVCLIKRIVDEEKLFDFDKKAVCTVVEYGVRLSGRQKKLSTRFSEIADLIREAHYWAKKDGSDLVSDKHGQRINIDGRPSSPGGPMTRASLSWRLLPPCRTCQTKQAPAMRSARSTAVDGTRLLDRDLRDPFGLSDCR
jgi:hypothetical protein